MKTFKRYFFSIIILVSAWKLASIFLSSNILPSPEVVFRAFGREIKEPGFWNHFGISAYRVATGMAVAWMVGFPAGVFLGYNRTADRILAPSVFLTYPIPKIVLLPVFLMLFGLGDASKILMIALITGYQILVATRDGVLGLDKKYIDSFLSIGGTPAQAVRHVIIPAALPQAFTALRIGAGTSIAVLFFVESFATSKGLGFFIMDYWGRADVELMFVGILGMSLLGVILYELFNYLEKNLCAWKYLETGRAREPVENTEIKSRILVFGRMIKFSHTIFALPFALAAVVLASREITMTPGVFFWVLVAMVGARSAAMGFNRIADAGIDAENPRTVDREIPSGKLSMKSAVVFVAVFSSLFILAAGMLSRLCLILAVPVLAILFFYSYTKRFTSFSHLYLGFAISLAPLGAWIAVTGGFDPRVITLSLALLFYIAGFDILYACQDVDYDKDRGLFSIPAKFGVRRAFHVSTLLHVFSFAAFFSVYLVFNLGAVYLAAAILIGILLVIEHKLVSPDDLTHIQMAFFHVNSAISIILFLGIFGDQVANRLF